MNSVFDLQIDVPELNGELGLSDFKCFTDPSDIRRMNRVNTPFGEIARIEGQYEANEIRRTDDMIDWANDHPDFMKQANEDLVTDLDFDVNNIEEFIEDEQGYDVFKLAVCQHYESEFSHGMKSIIYLLALNYIESQDIEEISDEQLDYIKEEVMKINHNNTPSDVFDIVDSALSITEKKNENKRSTTSSRLLEKLGKGVEKKSPFRKKLVESDSPKEDSLQMLKNLIRDLKSYANQGEILLGQLEKGKGNGTDLVIHMDMYRRNINEMIDKTQELGRIWQKSN